MNKAKSIINEFSDSLLIDNTDVNRKRWARHIIETGIPLADLQSVILSEHPVAMRFSWVLGELGETEPSVVFPCVKYFFAKRRDIRIPHFNRVLAKMFYLAGIPPEIEGEAIDELFKWLLDAGSNVSTKTFSLLALSNVISKYPGLKNEFRLIVEDQLGKNSISFKKKAEKILKGLGAAGAERV
jgi:hypothetical protein